MSRYLIAALLSGAFITGIAAAHPHGTEKEKVTKSTSASDSDLNAYFEKHAKKLKEAIEGPKTQSRIIVKKLDKDDRSKKHHHGHTSKRIEIIENPEDLRDAAKDIQNMLAESKLLENLADMVIEMAEDIEIRDTGDGVSLSFDGKKIGSFSLDGDDSVTLDGFGSNTTIEKDVIIKDGKKKTRIVIETDADDNTVYEIVPKAKKGDKGSGF